MSNTRMLADEQDKNIQTYLEICRAAMKAYDWIVEINDYCLPFADIESGDFKNVKPWIVGEVNLDDVILYVPSDVDFYSLRDPEGNKNTFFSQLMDFKNGNTDSKNFLNDVKAITHEAFYDEYLIMFNMANIISELTRTNDLHSRSFYDLYHFYDTYASKLFPDSKSVFDSPFVMCSTAIMFFLSKVKDMKYDFDKKEFVEEKIEIGGDKDFLL